MKPDRTFIPNLPVSDLRRTKAFWSAHGFSFNPQYTSENSVCIEMNERSKVMFVPVALFEKLTGKPVPDLSQSCAVTLAFTSETRKGVDEVIDKVLKAGGAKAHEPEDQGFMYDCGFLDPDGHAWSVYWVNPHAAQE